MIEEANATASLHCRQHHSKRNAIAKGPYINLRDTKPSILQVKIEQTSFLIIPEHWCLSVFSLKDKIARKGT